MTFLTFRVIFLTAVFALAANPVCFWLAKTMNLMDVPGSAPHKLHHHTMPLAGGLAILISIFASGLVFGALPSAWPLLIPSLLVFLFGLADDFWGLSAPWKLLGQISGALLLIQFGVHIRLFQQNWINFGLTLMWMVGITNAYNFVDSMDGLATGLAGMAAAFFMLVTYDSLQLDLSLVSAVLLGACIGIFYFTASPAKFFLGDAGSQFLGFLLAGLAIAYNPLGFLRIQSWFVPILLVGVPIFDTTLVVFSRLRRRKPVYRSGLDHTYHRLVALGIDSNRAVMTMHFSALLLGCLAFIALSLSPWLANTIFGLCVITGVLGILFLDRRSQWP